MYTTEQSTMYAFMITLSLLFAFLVYKIFYIRHQAKLRKTRLLLIKKDEFIRRVGRVDSNNLEVHFENDTSIQLINIAHAVLGFRKENKVDVLYLVVALESGEVFSIIADKVTKINNL